ncbi:CopD family protein [Saccharospirillum mangrovi]|uniref:CopD family protein n=1 Tax=Saccharospirillum mangrovi TaxID=2161747 RepID=UPI000D36428E|nr:CopD family protein [Saccharospirillum mangrovi]
MLYLLTKSLHILAVIIWLSGFAALAIGLLTPGKAHLELLHRWDKRVTNPALALVWVLGLILAYWGGWFGATWLWIKLAAVFVLSGLHGTLSGRTRRALKNDSTDQLQSLAKPALGLSLLLVALAILMVETKFY